MPTVHPRSAGPESTPHTSDYVVVDHNLAAVNPGQVDGDDGDRPPPGTGAREARRVLGEAGKKLTREEYLTLRPGLDGQERYGALIISVREPDE
jgi:hypothetical protein